MSKSENLKRIGEKARRAADMRRENRLVYRRHMMAGNAGGLLIAINLGGVLIKKSPSPTFPEELIIPIFLFGAGLFCAWASAMIERVVQAEKLGIIIENKVALKSLDSASVSFVRIASAAVLVGSAATFRALALLS